MELDDIAPYVRRGIDRPGRTVIGVGRKTPRDAVLDRLRQCAATLPVALIVWEDPRFAAKVGDHLMVDALSEVPTGNPRLDRGRMISARRFGEADPDKRWVLS